MPFALNGNTILEPTTHKWVIPNSYGTSGQGRILYPGIYAYELNWAVMLQTEYNVLVNAYMSGSVVSSLPVWRGANITGSYTFQNYTGTYLSLPEFASYFEGTYQNVKLVINNVPI